MPRPADSETEYLPGLDGIRAIAVAAVVGYHLGAPWLPGDLLGVAVFFTLSGYLITTILISTWDRSGNLDMRHFWVDVCPTAATSADHGGLLIGAALAMLWPPSQPDRPVLGVLPLRWIGERSYGIYLWHLPVVAFMPQAVLATSPLVRAGVLGYVPERRPSSQAPEPPAEVNRLDHEADR